MSRLSRSCKALGEASLAGVASAVVFLIGLALLSGALSPRGSVERTPNPRPGSLGAVGDVAARHAVHDDSSLGVPVLCHHYLRAKTTPRGFVKILGALFLNLPLLDDMDVWTQTATAFDGQMAHLKREGYETVDLNDVVAWRRGLRELPPKPVVITFDDGDRSVLDYAYPILEKYGFKATLFVVTSQVGQRWERVDCLGWDELRRLQESGVFSIQSHSHDLHRKVKTSEGNLPVFVAARLGEHQIPGAASWADAVYRDLRGSKELIERHLGNTVSCLSWPYGFGDAALDSVAVSAGYSALCTLGGGTNWRFRTGPPAGSAGTVAVDPGGLRFEVPAAPGHLGFHIAEGAAVDKLDWGQKEIRRYTVTARTSLRGFKKMLAESSGTGE